MVLLLGRLRVYLAISWDLGTEGRMTFSIFKSGLILVCELLATWAKKFLSERDGARFVLSGILVVIVTSQCRMCREPH
jgi:hypothetical protein